jgi:hypothetical protein
MHLAKKVSFAILSLLMSLSLNSCCTIYNGLFTGGTNQRIRVQVWKSNGCTARLTTNPPSEWGLGNFVIPANVSFYDTESLTSQDAIWLYLSKERDYSITVSSPCYLSETVNIKSTFCQLDKKLIQIKLLRPK